MREKIYIEGAGCNRRKLDLERIRTYLEINGYILVNSPEKADRIIVGTCAFKRKEEDQSVARLEALRKHSGKTVVFGCLPDIAPERFASFGDLPKVAPKELEKIGVLFSGSQQAFNDVSESHLLPTGRASMKSSRHNLAMLKIGSELDVRDVMQQALVAGGQRFRSLLNKTPELFYLLVCRGCLGKCSYCAIRRSIGPVKSKPVAAIIEDLQAGISQGYREFVILGDDTGCYGVDIGSSLTELIDALASSCEEHVPSVVQKTGPASPPALHLREVHPKFLIAYADSLSRSSGMTKVRSLLCPIQSGSDRILEKMEREHTMKDLAMVLNKLKREYPWMTISTQIIVGFPGERDDEFRQTLEVVKDIAFDSVVIFPYDNKGGTSASMLPGRVSPQVVRKRMRDSFRYFRKTGIQALYSCPQ